MEDLKCLGRSTMISTENEQLFHLPSRSGDIFTMLIRTACCLFAVVLFACLAFSQIAVPRFEPGPCAIPVPDSEKHVECGYLVVPENRAAKSGKTIRLPVAILKSDNPNLKPDPVLRTLGGPGASSLKLIRGRRSSPWLKDRDYIIFEQRGTKYAEPALECPEVDASNIDAAKRRLDAGTSKRNVIKAAAACFARLKAAGIDLNGYNSAENAADIEDLRRALKIDKINLYGVSYSSRLMLDVLRYFPDGIRSVAIESVLAPEVNYDEVGVDAMVRSLNELFAGCRAQTDCAAAFPDLEREFYAVVARLNAKPAVVPTKHSASAAMIDIELNGNDFATWIVDYLFSNEPAATIEAPLAIHRAFTGDLVKQFKGYSADKLNGSFYSWGMRYSVWCSEERPFESSSAILRQSSKYPGLKGYEVMALPDICSVWKVKRAAPIANRPVTSNVPTLVLAAQYDAYIPPAWGRDVAQRLNHSFFIEVPWAGHGPGFSVPCVSQMIADFFDDPSRRPADECIGETRKQFKFVTKVP